MLAVEELETLEAIFGDEFSKTESSYKVDGVSQLTDKQIRVLLSDENPSIWCNLLFEYPPDYPNTIPHYSLSAKWLTTDMNQTIQEKFDRIFADLQGEPVIFQWVDYLRTSCADDLGIQGELIFSNL
jgi:hypothetical protein